MAAVGNMQGPMAGFSTYGYKGRMAWLQIFNSAISELDSLCLFSVPDLVAGCPEDKPENVLGELISTLAFLVPASVV